jgi:hypothetical protein
MLANNTMTDDQNPLLRRAYLIRPRAEFTTVLRDSQLGADDVEYLSRPIVSMTELLPYEGKLEGYRALVLKNCKEAFIRELFEYLPLADDEIRHALLGEIVTLEGCFDSWWTAEEIETIEVPTTW